MLKRLLNGKGFTLLENIITTSLIATGLLGLALVMQNNVIHTVNSDNNVKAVNLAQEKIESIIADTAFLGYQYVTEDAQYTNEELEGGFRRYVSITEVSESDLDTPTEGSGLNKVDVEVVWGEANDQKVKLSTIVAEYDTSLE